jgi:aminopeptidase N
LTLNLLEPWIRAEFSIFLRHGSNYTALSNMPHKSSEPDIEDSEYLVTSFYTTPPIPAYLIAFVISDYSYIEDKSYKIPLRVFSKRSEINDGQLALNVSGKILNELEKYFDVEYALPKMDQVEFPEFSSGAMENWVKLIFLEFYFEL